MKPVLLLVAAVCLACGGASDAEMQTSAAHHQQVEAERERAEAQRERDQELAEAQREREQELAEAQREREQELAEAERERGSAPDPLAACAVDDAQRKRACVLTTIQSELMRRYDFFAAPDAPTDVAERRRFLRERLQGFVPTHPNTTEDGWPDRVFKDTGIVYGSVTDVALPPLTGVSPLRPSLLLYSDAYRLIGCGYAGVRSDLDDGVPPRGLPIHPEEWFIHLEGMHLANGSFVPVSFDAAASAGAGAWHPEMWDVHVFFVRAGVPVVGVTRAYLSPFSDASLETLPEGTPDRPSGAPDADVPIYRHPDGVQW